MSAARRRDTDDTDDTDDGAGPSDFEEAVSDVRPLAGRDRVRPPPVPARRARSSGPPPQPVRFERVRSGARVEGLAPGIDREHLRRLRAGRVAVDARVDLHGLEARDARRTLHRALAEALEAGARCVLVVHGRGLHSRGDPVLKRSLPDWLAEPPIGAQVMAFASAAPRDGGEGASYVLLRRPR